MADHLNQDGALDSEKYEASLDKYERELAEYQPKHDAWRKANESFENWKKETTARRDKVNGTWKGIADKGKELIPDWDQLMKSPEANGTIQIGDPIERYCRDLGDEGRADVAARLVEYLLRKPEDLKRIQGLNAKKQMEEYAALEVAILDELSGKSKEEPEQKPERKLTSAGKPPVQVGGGNSSPDDDGSPDAAFQRKDLTQEQRGELYRERMNKRDAEKRRKSGRR